MQIQANEIHIWSKDLIISEPESKEKFILLSPDETIRALRFHNEEHRLRFVAARGFLREILSCYLNIEPQKIEFDYNENKKPKLKLADNLQFNLSHSDNLAVYAITQNHSVGIDIEKIKQTDHLATAERYFTKAENQLLLALPKEAQHRAFFQLWTRKEALIKAVGKGLHIPLSSFSVTALDGQESILFENKNWTLMSLAIHEEYAAALATDQVIGTIRYIK